MMMPTIVPAVISRSMDRSAGRVACEDCKDAKATGECWDCAAQLCRACYRKGHAKDDAPCCGRCDRSYANSPNRPYNFNDIPKG